MSDFMMMMMMMMISYFEICGKYDTYYHMFTLDNVRKTWRLATSERFIQKLERIASSSFLMVLSSNLYYFSG
jgi:hypothetical protein